MSAISLQRVEKLTNAHDKAALYGVVALEEIKAGRGGSPRYKKAKAAWEQTLLGLTDCDERVSLAEIVRKQTPEGCELNQLAESMMNLSAQTPSSHAVVCCGVRVPGAGS